MKIFATYDRFGMLLTFFKIAAPLLMTLLLGGPDMIVEWMWSASK